MPTRRNNKPPTALDQEVKTFYLPKGDVVITRRHLLYGALGTAGVAAVGKGVSVLYEQTHANDDDIDVLKVRDDQVTVSEDLSEKKLKNTLALVGDFKMDYGTLLWVSDDDLAACLVPGEKGHPLTEVQLLSLGSGNTTTVLKQAVGHDDGYDIYDVRATSSGVIWAEADILEGTWRIFAASLNGGLDLGEPQMLCEGITEEWETPSIAAVKGYCYWQILPNPEGPMRTEQSMLMKASFGQNEGETIWYSTGRMCTPIYAGENYVVITPRAESDGVNYTMTCLDADTNAVLDTCTLPQSMKPLEAGYGPNGFNFSFDAIYNYGDGISQMGTYYPLSPVTGSAYSDAKWLRFSRTPSAAACSCGQYFVVKSTRAVIAIDTAGLSYCATDVLSGSDTYGEYLASTGTRSTFVTYTNINHKPIGGKAEKACHVHVYAPVTG